VDPGNAPMVVFVSNEELEAEGDENRCAYVAIRFAEGGQGGLLADGSSVLHFAVASANIWDWEPV